MFKINKKIVFISALVFIFAYICGGNMPYAVFYTFSMAIVSGLIFIYICRKNLHARFEYDNKIYNVSDTAKLSIILKNSGILPMPYVYVESKMLRQLIEGYRGDFLFLGIGNDKWIDNEVTFKIRGIYGLSDISLQISDLFCIFKSVRNIHEGTQIKVYPKVYNLGRVSINGNDSYESLINSKNGIHDFTLIKDVRKYNMGDSLKKVHWKLSAKYGDLYVKNFDAVSGKGCNLFVNMHVDNVRGSSNEIIEEHMVDFTVSLTKYMLDYKIKTKLLIHANEQRCIDVEVKEDFSEVMEYFLKCKSDATTEFHDFIKLNLTHIPKRNLLGIICIDIDDNLRNVIITLKEMKYDVNVFYYKNPLQELKNIILLENLGIRCINFRVN